ncbi:MAG: hypothetical protein ABH950_05180 [Candidatus Altiarchaeota archaeon]
MKGINPNQLFEAHKEEVEEVEALCKEFGLPPERVLDVIEKIALAGPNPKYVLEVLRDPELRLRLKEIKS